MIGLNFTRKAYLILEPALGFGAPWNMTKNAIYQDDEKGYLINDNALIFFHFHQFKIFRNDHFFWCSRFYGGLSAAARSMFKKNTREESQDARQLLGPEYSSDLQSETWIRFHLVQYIKDSTPLFIKKLLKKNPP